MSRPFMYGPNRSDAWDVDTAEGLASAVEWMERHVATVSDNHHWIIPRTGSMVVIVRSTKQAIRVLGVAPETGTRKVFAAMGWRFIDKANGEAVDEN